MAAETSKILWNTTLTGNELNAADGELDVLIIAPDESPHTPHSADVIPRRKAELTNEDKRHLSGQGIAEKHWRDDASIMNARYTLDKDTTVVGVKRNEPDGSVLHKNYVLQQIELLMKSSTKPRVYIYFVGAGKKQTGEWCFQDGYITFEDIANLYLRHREGAFSGQVLGIITDCSYSGSWVNTCTRFLQEHGVQPCGHSAKDKGFLLKVYASCQPTEVPAAFAFSTRCAKNDKNTSALYFTLRDLKGDEIYNAQHPCGLDFTKIRCNNKSIKEKCSLPPEYTWQKLNEGKRVFMVKGRDKGRPAWHYVLVVDDDETIRLFKEKTQGESAGVHTINMEDYGVVIKSGWGEEPPKEVKDWIGRVYTGTIN